MNESKDKWLIIVATVIAIGGLGYAFLPPRPGVAPSNPPPAVPEPYIPPKPAPHKCPFAAASVGDWVSPDGAERLQIDYPAARHVANRSGTDGSGLCVFCSIAQAGDWCNDEISHGLFAWMQHQQGGGTPPKVDQMFRKYCKDRGENIPPYYQMLADDFEMIKLATRNRVMPCVSYHYSPSGRYGGQQIGHMVNVLHATDRWVAVLDNNYPKTIEWMTPAEFHQTWRGEWAIFLLTTPPAPTPHNRRLHMFELMLATALVAGDPVPPCGQTVAAIPPVRVSEWIVIDADPARVYLVADGRALAVYDYVTDEWRDRDGEHWGAPHKPPSNNPPPSLSDVERKVVEALRQSGAKLPPAAEPDKLDSKPAALNFGLETYDTANGYYCDGQPSTREALQAALDGVPDAAGKLRVTVIGTDEQRKPVLAQIAGHDVVLKEYTPNAWQLAWEGFVRTGQPTIYIQSADGTVLHRQDDGRDLAKALTRADPQYDPKADPDLRADAPQPPGPYSPVGPSPSPPSEFPEWRSLFAGAGGAAALYLLLAYLLPALAARKSASSDPRLEAILKKLENLK